MNISLNGYPETVVTFYYEGKLEPGDPVRMVGNKTVDEATDTDKFIGFVTEVNSGFVGVKTKGYFTYPYEEKPEFGPQRLGMGEYGIRINGDGMKVIVTDIDETNKTVGFIM